MRTPSAFRQQLRDDLQSFLARQQARFPADETLRIDLHCHDENSDVPDDLIDRIICSTEALMGLGALYLKHALNVPAHFYLHTDWLDFCRRALRFDRRNVDRVRRLLRASYRNFDGLFVLNASGRGGG